ncbi:MAG: Sec-dependent nitrous-oxide reductase [Thermodesulfobacteriota bacterium]
MMSKVRRIAAGMATVAAGFLLACSQGGETTVATSDAAPAGNPLDAVIAERGLTPEEAEAALKTFVPPGRYDEFVMFAAGGHSGNILLYGIPSMRLLKAIPVYAPDAWQGWGQGDEGSAETLAAGSFAQDLPTQTWGDLHHPQISLTDGKYDGEWVIGTDKSAGRVAIASLRDFKVKSIFKIPNTDSDHHGLFTDDSEYIVVSTFFPQPFNEPHGYAPLEDYASKYKGIASFLRFDRNAGKIVPAESFQIELPPYFQDLSILGRGPSEGLFFMNSMNVEMATGGNLEGKPAMEIGASQREMDYLHVVDWKKAAEVAKDPAKVKTVNGIRVIPLATAVAEKLLHFVPESKSPHGVDLVPGGEYVVVSGKLDPHVTVYSVDKIKKAIAEEKFEGKDEFGVPILRYDDVLEAHIETGLGPLHSVFDDRGHGYTSHFLDSTVVKWTIGPPYHPVEAAWNVVDKVPVHYNIGHLQAPGSNTKSPWGRYVVALNKWSVDRFPPLGPLHPQNLQLIDISGEKMKVLSDTPTIGEPHNSMMIPVELLQAWTVYPETGFDALTMAKSELATDQGQEKIERDGDTVTVRGTVVRSHFTPDIVRVKQGDKVVFAWTNVESARDATHGFGLHGYNVNLSIDPGATERAEIVASRPGVYPYYCTEFCSALHMEFTGWLLVEPKG